ncbi:hypothetical protein EMIT091MI3_270013 [Kosakonia quasisacchari]
MPRVLFHSLAEVSIRESMHTAPERGLATMALSGCAKNAWIAFESRIMDATALILHLTYRIISCCLKCTAKLCFLVDV